MECAVATNVIKVSPRGCKPVSVDLCASGYMASQDNVVFPENALDTCCKCKGGEFETLWSSNTTIPGARAKFDLGHLFMWDSEKNEIIDTISFPGEDPTAYLALADDGSFTMRDNNDVIVSKIYEGDGTGETVNYTQILGSVQLWKNNKKYVSPNGVFTLTQRGDGNLILYKNECPYCLEEGKCTEAEKKKYLTNDDCFHIPPPPSTENDNLEKITSPSFWSSNWWILLVILAAFALSIIVWSYPKA